MNLEKEIKDILDDWQEGYCSKVEAVQIILQVFQNAIHEGLREV